MKIYTRTGDKGKSSLFSGERIPKNHRRINAYGEVDELNSVIGALKAALPDSSEQLHEQLQAIQSTLFQIGALLATTAGSARARGLKSITAEHTRVVETYIDALQVDLPPLKCFILPGGHMTAAWAHIARTVCRRSERSVVGLADAMEAEGQGSEGLVAHILIYLNRLSDYFFVLARHCNRVAGIDDVPWQG